MNLNREVTPQSPHTPVQTVPMRRRSDIPRKVVYRGTSFDRYLRVLQKQMHPACKISSSSLTALNSMINSLFSRIAHEAKELAQKQKRCTLLHRDVVFACRLLFNNELFTHADQAGNVAVANYQATLEPSTPVE
ncbi:histone-fold-containing protein [Chlamydoabsidia padenii]|nr:histone-fold-containing protein [Chlamydoabsidia padenii]